MNQAAIAAEARKAGLPALSLNLPTADIAGKPITTGKLGLREFATYMRIHTLEATGGLTYAQMPRYATADGKGTNDATKALAVQRAAGRQPGTQPLGDRDRPDHGAQLELHGRAALRLRNRRRVSRCCSPASGSRSSRSEARSGTRTSLFGLNKEPADKHTQGPPVVPVALQRPDSTAGYDEAVLGRPLVVLRSTRRADPARSRTERAPPGSTGGASA